MTGADWLVIALGAGTIAWINWYFFLAERRVAVAGVTGGRQYIEIAVQGGYDPAEIRVEAGRPVRLVFFRQETSPCSEEVVIPDLGVRKFLPAGEKTAVDFTPDRSGTFDFTCGMGMLHGKLVVTPRVEG